MEVAGGTRRRERRPAETPAEADRPRLPSAGALHATEATSPAVAAVTLWCLTFGALHLFWAVGGRVGLAESAGADLAGRRPPAFVLVGLWGVALALLAVGIGVWRLDSSWRSRPRRRAAIVAAGLIGAGLIARGVVLEVVLALDLGGVASSVGSDQTTWSLLGWNPWFAVGGCAFLGLGRRWHRSRGRGALASTPG